MVIMIYDGGDRDNDDDDDDDVCLKWEQLSIGACALALPCLAHEWPEQNENKDENFNFQDSTWLGKH